MDLRVGVVGFTSTAAATDSFVTAVNTYEDNFSLINSAGQVVAAIVSAVPILRPIAIQVNTLAGTNTFLQMAFNVQNGKGFTANDVFTIVGNITGIVGTIVVMGSIGAPIIGTIITAVSVASAIGAVLTSDNMQRLKNLSVPIINEYFGSFPIPDLHNMWHVGEGQRLRTYQEVLNEGGFKCLVWGSNIDLQWIPCDPPVDKDAEGTDNDQDY